MACIRRVGLYKKIRARGVQTNSVLLERKKAEKKTKQKLKLQTTTNRSIKFVRSVDGLQGRRKKQKQTNTGSGNKERQQYGGFRVDLATDSRDICRCFCRFVFRSFNCVVKLRVLYPLLLLFFAKNLKQE